MESTHTAAGNGIDRPPAIADGQVTTRDLVLDPPVTDSSGKIWEVLHLTEPTVRQQYAAEAELKAQDAQSGRAYQIVLLSQVTGAPRNAIEQMRVSQFNEAFDFLIQLSSGGRATGSTL